MIRLLSPPPVPQIAWAYANDGMLTMHGSSFLQDPLFQAAYRLGKATGSWGAGDIEWRAYIACWAAAKGKSLEGDFVECGVNKGGYSRMVMHYIGYENMLDKRFYLVDTYNGIPAEHLDPENSALVGHIYSECYEEVKRTFAPFKNAVVVRGKVPDVLPQVAATKICYLSIDMNSATPEIAAAEFFWEKLSSGAVMVLDDYGFQFFSKQKRAFDDFARRKGVQVLALPTGQGLIFKP